MNLVLASASPRRRELLARIGVQFRVQPADIDESPLPRESASEYVQRMAREKAEAVSGELSDGMSAVLAADTTVVLDEDVFGKPRDRIDGLAMLARLSGRSHEVMTAVSLRSGGRAESLLVVTEVTFTNLSREVCEAYLDTDEPWDKAGAYAIQGRGGAFVSSISGSYSNVVGLPLCETWQLLAGFGIATGLTPLPADRS